MIEEEKWNNTSRASARAFRLSTSRCWEFERLEGGHINDTFLDRIRRYVYRAPSGKCWGTIQGWSQALELPPCLVAHLQLELVNAAPEFCCVSTTGAHRYCWAPIARAIDAWQPGEVPDARAWLIHRELRYWRYFLEEKEISRRVMTGETLEEVFYDITDAGERG